MILLVKNSRMNMPTFVHYAIQLKLLPKTKETRQIQHNQWRQKIQTIRITPLKVHPSTPFDKPLSYAYVFYQAASGLVYTPEKHYKSTRMYETV